MIEDDSITRREIRGIIEGLGFEVREARSFVEALAYGPGFDLYTVDDILPGGSGYELVRAFRAHTDAPIVMVATVRSFAARRKAVESGATAFLGKPFNPAYLRGVVMASF